MKGFGIGLSMALRLCWSISIIPICMSVSLADFCNFLSSGSGMCARRSVSSGSHLRRGVGGEEEEEEVYWFGRRRQSINASCFEEWGTCVNVCLVWFALTLCHFQPLCGDSVNEGRVRQGMAESLSLASCVCPGVGRSGRCICRKMNFIAL